MEKRILIVDDDSRNIFALGAVLRSRGYGFTSCLDAAQAIRTLKTGEHFDAVLLDMMMPEIDGYEAIGLIRQIPLRSALPIIAVTAQAMSGDREKSLAAGADDYISKPVDIDRLIEILSKL